MHNVSGIAFNTLLVGYVTTYVSRREVIQGAQLSQRDRAAGFVIVFAKSRTGTGRQYFTDIISLSSTIMI